MNQAGNRDGSFDDGWDQDDGQLPPSLGVWPLGRTYVHPSDGALNTGPAASGHGAPGPNGHGAPGPNGHGAPSPNGHGGPAASSRGEPAAAHGGPAGRPLLYPVDGPYRQDPVAGRRPRDDWPAERAFEGDHVAAQPFTGAAGDGSTPLYERLALSERPSPPPPVGPGPPRSGRPPLYQVGGKYRGDDWPTDPGFRRGDLDLEDLPTDPAPDGARPDPGDGRALGGGPDPGHGQPRREPTLGGPDPRYEQSPRDADQRWQGGGNPDGATAHAGPGSYWPPGYETAPGHGGAGSAAARHGAAAGHGAAVWSGAGRGEPWPAPPPAATYDAGAGMAAPPPEQGERGRPDPRLKAVPSLYPRLVFLVVGYAGITSLAAAYAEAIPLPITASLVVIPAAGVIFNMGMRYPDWGRRALVGWLAGIVATIVYGLLRLSLVKVGIWGDPIPGIGRLVFADPHANFAWGYLWRFAGNGGGMGIAYTMLPWRGVRGGIAYGTLICTGLVALLFFFPVAQVHIFPLTPVTTVGAYAGHWVYGAVLGKITSWWLPPVELGRIHGRLTARLIHPGHRPRPAHARSGGAAGDPRRAARRSA